MDFFLRIKIFLGYVLIVVIIFSFWKVLSYSRLELLKLENIINETEYARKNIYKAHLYITKLVTLGESVIAWNESDYNKYHHQRLKTDSVLIEIIKSSGVNSLLPVQIDSLRALLETKEMHLFRIMQAVQSWEKSDSILANELPVIATQSVRMKTITQKKKGIAGLFGKKETVQVPYITNEIQDFNERLTSARDWRNNQMEAYADSLRLQNRLLNHKLYDFVSSLDNQIQQSFTEQYQKITETIWKSFRLFAIVISIVIVLFVISFFIILSDLRKEEKIKVKLQQSVQENEDLLEMRKRIILTVSHDIRGPLGNIHNCADLASQTREKKKREPYLEDIRHSCHHILHLVNDLMDAYRINEAGDLRNDTPFYLDRFLQRISEEFSRKAVAKALFLQYEHQNSSFVVKGDADKLEQVLANLLTNAIKFTPSGTISFYSKYLEGKLHIEIRDTGIGMDEETQKRIFAPFERAAQNVNSEGFGLGLFLTKGTSQSPEWYYNCGKRTGKGKYFQA